MAEKHPNSKLKRKKPAAEEHQPEIFYRRTLQKSHIPLSASDRTAGTEGSVPTAAWWSGQHPPALENLWALTLRCALPQLDTEPWGTVPHLPSPSTVRPTTNPIGKHQWCDLSEEVPPFPEPSPPPARPPASPGPLALKPSHEEVPVQTRLIPLEPCPSVQDWEVTASLLGPGSVRGKGGEEKAEDESKGSSLIKRQPPANQWEISDSRPSLQKGGGKEEEEEEEEEEVPGSSRRDGGDGGGLQSCPMCLVVFPAGFTQMDCDSHLAQCLSEMNVDMTW